MFTSIRDVVFITRDDDQIRVAVVTSREFNINLEIVHDFTNIAATAPDQSGVNAWIDFKLFFYELVQFSDDL